MLWEKENFGGGEVKSIVSIGLSFEKSLWSPLAVGHIFKAMTAVYELCHNGWKKFCNQEFFLSFLHGLRILDIP